MTTFALMRSAATLGSMLLALPAHAQGGDPVYSGGGLGGGLAIARLIDGPFDLSLRQAIIVLLTSVLELLALAAVVSLIVAGYWLVMGGGSENAKNRAKAIIVHVCAGLLLVLFARTIVGLLTRGLF